MMALPELVLERRPRHQQQPIARSPVQGAYRVNAPAPEGSKARF